MEHEPFMPSLEEMDRKESEHLSVSWLDENNKAFVVTEKRKNDQYAVSAHIEDEDAFGTYSDEEYAALVQKVTGFETEKDSDHSLSRRKWDYCCPATKICASEEEAREYAAQLLNNREHWLDADEN